MANDSPAVCPVCKRPVRLTLSPVGGCSPKDLTYCLRAVTPGPQK